MRSPNERIHTDQKGKIVRFNIAFCLTISTIALISALANLLAFIAAYITYVCTLRKLLTRLVRRLKMHLIKHANLAPMSWVRPNGNSPGQMGFSVVEVLIVITIMIILSALALPSLASLVGAGGLRSNATTLSGILEESYSTALARNTYVWVGFSQLPNGGGLAVGAVFSPHEDPNDFPSNVTVLTKPAIFPNLNLTAVDPTRYVGSNLATKSVCEVSSVTSGAQQAFPVTFAGTATPKATVLQISPSGQVTVVTQNKFAWVELGLASLNGNAKDAAAVQMNAFTGRVSIYQP
jgi:type II secretory pathway pseudopilin PulG